MKKIKLFGLLSLFVIPILTNVLFTNASKYEPNLVANELKEFNKSSLTDPNPDTEDCFRVNGVEYDTFTEAITAATDSDTIQVLKDFTPSNAPQPETEDDLPPVAINKSLTINGIGDDGISHQIISQKIDISGGATVNFENVIIDGNKKWNKNGANGNHYLIKCNASTINLKGHTIIRNYKFDGFCMIKLESGSTLSINDQTEITDCAAKYGLIRYDTDSTTNRPAVYMNGGKIHGNYSSNRGLNVDGYVEGLVFYVFGGATENDSAKFYMYDGEIYNNTARCWDDPTQCNSVGLVFLHNNWFDIKILGGSIHNNVAKLGGAVTFGYHCASSGYKPNGNIEIGGNAYIYGNHGVDDNDVQFDSNIYFDRPDVGTKKVVVSDDCPLTEESKTGILFSEEDLPIKGESRTAVHNASLEDLSHFVADNEDYMTIYEGDAKHSIAIYHYLDPVFTPPTIVDKDNLTYTGNPQSLIATPGNVTKGGTMMYSTDYDGDITTAHWTSNPNEVTGTNATGYNVTYYVTKSVTEGTSASTPVTIATNIIPNTSLTPSSIVDIKNQTYTGNQIRPTIVIKDGDKTLIEGIDYTVEYSNNVEMGTARVKVTLKGNYSGTIEKTFAIVPVVCIIHWFILVVLLLGLGAYAFIYFTKRKNLYAYIVCGAGILITAVLEFFGGCSVCLAFGITNIIVFVLGAGFINFKRQKEETKEENYL